MHRWGFPGICAHYFLPIVILFLQEGRFRRLTNCYLRQFVFISGALGAVAFYCKVYVLHNLTCIKNHN